MTIVDDNLNGAEINVSWEDRHDVSTDPVISFDVQSHDPTDVSTDPTNNGCFMDMTNTKLPSKIWHWCTPEESEQPNIPLSCYEAVYFKGRVVIRKAVKFFEGSVKYFLNGLQGQPQSPHSN